MSRLLRRFYASPTPQNAMQALLESERTKQPLSNHDKIQLSVALAENLTSPKKLFLSETFILGTIDSQDPKSYHEDIVSLSLVTINEGEVEFKFHLSSVEDADYIRRTWLRDNPHLGEQAYEAAERQWLRINDIDPDDIFDFIDFDMNIDAMTDRFFGYPANYIEEIIM